MNIFEFAMSMEKEGERFYRDLAKKNPQKGLKTIFLMLAEDEEKHYHIIIKMKESMATEVKANQILAYARSIFSQMNQKDILVSPNIDFIDLYKRAQEIEKKSEEFYLLKAGEIKDPEQKRLFILMAEEEKKHYVLLENIIHFVSKPKEWLENAEFNHLDEY